jgi:hypothetical protein
LIKVNSDTISNSKIKIDFIKRFKLAEDSFNLEYFFNKKNKIFEKISASRILEDIKNNYEYVVNFENNKLSFSIDSIDAQISKIGNQRIKNKLLGNFINNDDNNYTYNLHDDNFLKLLDTNKLKFQEDEFLNSSISINNDNSFQLAKRNSKEDSFVKGKKILYLIELFINV